MNVLSFFSGAMGLDQGLSRAGFTIRSVCEHDAACIQTIQHNHPEMPLIRDIFDVSGEDVLEKAGMEAKDVFMIAGGPPCQSFSTAGKRKGMDCINGNAMQKYLEIIAAIRPPYVLVENVRGLISSGGGADLETVVSTLQSAGYTTSFDLYNTANFGVPQCRERLIIIGSLRGKVPYIPQTHSEGGTHNLHAWRTFRQATSNITEHEFTRPRENVLNWMKHVPEGMNWRSLPEEMKKQAMGGSIDSGGGKSGFFRRIWWDKPSPTVVTCPTQKSTLLFHPQHDRPLSVQEYHALQTFPESWVVCGSLAARYKQIGNAVPVLFAECIGRLVLNHASNQPIPRSPLPNSRYNNTSDETWKKRKIKN